MGFFNWLFTCLGLKQKKTTWTLQEFSKLHGKMQYLESLGRYRFIKCNKETIVYVAGNLRQLSPEELVKKNNIFIMRFPNGNYCICSKLEDVDLNGNGNS